MVALSYVGLPYQLGCVHDHRCHWSLMTQEITDNALIKQVLGLKEENQAQQTKLDPDCVCRPTPHLLPFFFFLVSVNSVLLGVWGHLYLQCIIGCSVRSS